MNRPRFSIRYTALLNRAAAIARELSDPMVSIGETAERFGFSNTFYFSRFFKRHFGVGPQAYRKQIPALREGR